MQQPALAASAGDSDNVVPFTIELGETATGVADRLQEMGLISDAGLFRLYMRYNGIDQQLEAGDFELAYSMTMPEIAQALQQALVRTVSVTIPEGWRAEQVAELLEQQGIMEADNFMASVRAGDPVALGLGQYSFLNDRPSRASLEGYLFPDTYRIPAKAEPADLLGACLITSSKRRRRTLVPPRAERLQPVASGHAGLDRRARGRTGRRTAADCQRLSQPPFGRVRRGRRRGLPAGRPDRAICAWPAR